MANGAPVRIQLEGEFDVRAARRLAALLEQASTGDRFHLDFSRVTQFQDFGVAVLAQALKCARLLDVQVAGLRHHQLKMLRYFGLNTDAVGAP